MLAILEGKKTYIIAFLGAALVLAEQFGFIVPGWALPILGFLGLGTLRSAVSKPAE
jgi:hypothetical protein